MPSEMAITDLQFPTPNSRPKGSQVDNVCGLVVCFVVIMLCYLARFVKLRSRNGTGLKIGVQGLNKGGVFRRHFKPIS